MLGAWDSTTVEAMGDGRYRAVIGPEWVLAMTPQGGVIAAVAARAMAAELATDQPLRSIHSVFVSPVMPGPVEITVTVLRRGRSMSQAQVTVANEGSASGFTALALFGGDRQGFEFTELVMPEVPDPDRCQSGRGPFPPGVAEELPDPWPFWDQIVENRVALGSPWWEDAAPDVGEAASWFRFDHPPVLDGGLMDPLGLLVLVDVMPSAVFRRLGRTEERWFGPSADLTVHVFGHATPGWILSHTKAHQAGDGYASVEAALWDPRGEGGPKLVAWGTQQMFFTKMP